MKRAVRTLIRLVAAGLVIFGGLAIGLEYERRRLQSADIVWWHCIVGVILIALGVVLFAVSTGLAERLTEDFDE